MGLKDMRKYLMIVIAFMLVAIMAGCMGAGKVAPAEETDADSTATFIFAETPVLDINSDLMADKFGSNLRMGMDVKIDSATALKTVYEILEDSLLGQDAANFDLKTEEPALYQQYKNLRYDRVMRLMFQEVIVDSVTVNDSEVMAAYEADKDSFLIPTMYRARHIVVAGDGLKHTADSLYYKTLSDQKLDSIARAMVVDYRQRIMNGGSFDTLAMLYSQDVNTAGQGGDLGYFELARMVPPFDSTVEHTPIDSVSGVIKTEYGWHIVKVEDFAPEHYLPLDSVYDKLEYKVKDKRVADRSHAYMDSLRANANIVIDTAALMMADSLHQPGDVMAVINPRNKKYGNDSLYFRDYNEQVYAYKRFKKIQGDLAFGDKVDIINGISMRPLLIEAARELGYYNNPQVETWAEQTIKKYAVSSLRKRLLDDPYEPTEEECRAYYDSHSDDYLVERPLTVQHIVFADSNLAEYVRDLLMSGMDFMEMVDKYYPGDPEIRRAAADLGDIGPDDMPYEFYAAAKRTPVGEISHPVKTMYGYHLIKVLKKTQSIDFDRARVDIEAILKKQHLEDKRRKFVEDRLESPPVIHWAMLDKLYFEKPHKPDFSQFRK